MNNPCIDAIQKAGGGNLTEDEIMELAERIQSRRNSLMAQGQVDNLDMRLRQAAKEEGDKARLAAALMRKQAALNAIARDKLETAVVAHIDAGLSYRDSVLAVLEGTTRGVEGGRVSVAATKLAFEARFAGDMMATIERNRPHVVHLLDDKPFLDDVVREMFELRKDGQPGRTGNADAAYVAKTFATFAELSRTDLNRLGANIGKLDGWAGPQVHDPFRLLQTSEADWMARIMPRLDLERSFPGKSEAEIADILKDTYRTIVTGRDNTITAREKGQFVGPANLARSLEQTRVLHFKDAENWIAYQQEFGHGNVFSAMYSHQQRAARLAGQMQVLGPNPANMLGSLLENLQRRVRNAADIPEERKSKIIAALTADGHGAIASSFAEVRGLTLAPEDASMAQIGSGIRAVQSMAKLGGALISSLPADTVTSAANLNFNGMNIFRSYGNVIAEFLKGRGDRDRREIAFLLGEGFDGIVGQVLHAGVANDTAPGVISRTMEKFFRWTGLTWETDVMRAANARVLSAWVGTNAEKGYGQLDEQFRHVLGLHGITEPQWEAIRQAQFRVVDGRTYVTPDRIRDLPDEAVRPLVKDRLDAMQAGIAERKAKAAEADARESQWVQGRMDKFQAALADGRARLAQLIEGRQGRTEAQTGALRDRIDLLSARIEQAQVAADIEGALRGLDTQQKVRGLLDAVEGGRTAVKVAGQTDKVVERQAGRDMRTGEILGRRQGAIESRIADLEKRIAAEDKASADWQDQKAADFQSFFRDRQDELVAFMEKMSERRTRRAEAVAAEEADIPRREGRIMDEGRFDLEMAMRRYFADEVGFGMLEPDEAVRRQMYFGVRSGTKLGEALRFLWQFKAFPLAFTDRVLGRAWYGGRGETTADRLLNNAGHIGHLIAGLTVAGYMSMSAKDMLKGYEPRHPDDAKGWGKTISAAMVQGGGAGIFGDYLFGEANRFGGGVAETALGPAIGSSFDLLNIWNRAREGDMKAGDTLNWVVGNTPFANLFYVKPALDYLVLNSLREAASPGYLGRQERKRYQEYGQNRLWNQQW